MGTIRKKEESRYAKQEEKFAGTWVYRIMINTAKDYVKKYGREYETLNENMIDTMAQESDMDLREAVDKLPMQENLSTVKSRLYRTLEKLRKELERNS